MRTTSRTGSPMTARTSSSGSASTASMMRNGKPSALRMKASGRSHPRLPKALRTSLRMAHLASNDLSTTHMRLSRR
jgi:hypothetical protein